MVSMAQVSIHPSQFPDKVQRSLLESLRSRRVNHKFHYQSYKQSRKWLALHEACSPVRTEMDVAAIYQRSFASAVKALPRSDVHVVGLGCGGGQKEARLLEALRTAGRRVDYTPCDVSLPLVLTARAAASAAISESCCFPLVCDLAETEDLAEVLDDLVENIPHARFRGQASAHSLSRAEAGKRASTLPAAKRIFTFFGMLPNFEPEVILPRLAGWLRPGDQLLLSANLAPGNDYAAGVRQILPQYDNELTRDWLLTFLLDLGVEKRDGDLQFRIENKICMGVRLYRIAAHFVFKRIREIHLEDQRVEFKRLDKLRLFFSYRYTPELVQALLLANGLKLQDQWVADSREEGVFAFALEGPMGGRKTKQELKRCGERPQSKD